MGVEISDQLLCTFVPIAVYWIYSGLYVALGSWSDGYRLHSREDEEEKNAVSKGTVVKGILLQQLVQTLVATLLYPLTVDSSRTTDGTSQNATVLTVPRQIVTAMIVQDTWQYLIHRLMHEVKFLYKHVHSKHHRLVVPYAYGALYNHPVEVASGMSPRVAVAFYTVATVKTVDDHCGLVLPGNLIHRVFENNVAYHDIHHQHYGCKSNFSQSFFVVWDRILGTYLPYSVDKRESGGFEARPKSRAKKCD